MGLVEHSILCTRLILLLDSRFPNTAESVAERNWPFPKPWLFLHVKQYRSNSKHHQHQDNKQWERYNLFMLCLLRFQSKERMLWLICCWIYIPEYKGGRQLIFPSALEEIPPWAQCLMKGAYFDAHFQLLETRFEEMKTQISDFISTMKELRRSAFGDHH